MKILSHYEQDDDVKEVLIKLERSNGDEATLTFENGNMQFQEDF